MGQTGIETEKFLWGVWAARLRDRLCYPNTMVSWSDHTSGYMNP